jgi:hypothetical protein
LFAIAFLLAIVPVLSFLGTRRMTASLLEKQRARTQHLRRKREDFGGLMPVLAISEFFRIRRED